MIKLLSLTNIFTSAWRKYLLYAQMHSLKDTSCSCSKSHNPTAQHLLNYEWNLGEECLYNNSCTTEQNSVFPHWWWDHYICTCACHHRHGFRLPLLPMLANTTASQKRVFHHYATILMKNSCLSMPV